MLFKVSYQDATNVGDSGFAPNIQDLNTKILRPHMDFNFLPGFNTKKIGFGFYHCGIEVYGVEYAFGGSDNSKSGIVKLEPRQFQGLRLRKSILMGRTEMSEKECQDFIKNGKGVSWEQLQHHLQELQSLRH